MTKLVVSSLALAFVVAGVGPVLSTSTAYAQIPGIDRGGISGCGPVHGEMTITYDSVTQTTSCKMSYWQNCDGIVRTSSGGC